MDPITDRLHMKVIPDQFSKDVLPTEQSTQVAKYAVEVHHAASRDTLEHRKVNKYPQIRESTTALLY